MIVDDLGDTEIWDLDAIIMNEYVFRLYIPMDDIPVLKELEGYDYLSNETSNDLIRKPFLVLHHEVFQSSFVAVLNE